MCGFRFTRCNYELLSVWASDLQCQSESLAMTRQRVSSLLMWLSMEVRQGVMSLSHTVIWMERWLARPVDASVMTRLWMLQSFALWIHILDFELWYYWSKFRQTTSSRSGWQGHLTLWYHTLKSHIYDITVWFHSAASTSQLHLKYRPKITNIFCGKTSHSDHPALLVNASHAHPTLL